MSAFVDGCDYIFYFAGLTGTARGFESFREFIEVNEIGLLNALSACRDVNPRPKVIFPSSRLVYKGQRVALKEEDEKEFKTVYALNKYSGEQYLKMYADCFGVKYAVFRICVPYGTLLPGNQSYGTLSHFMSQARERREIVIFGDGEQRRTFVHIDDLVRILVVASFSPLTDNGIFNIGGADHLTIRSVAERIARKYSAKVRFVSWPELAARIESGDTVFDSSRLDNLLGVEYHYTLDQWLESLDI